MSGDLAWLDATAQAELVRRRQATPLELTDAAIAVVEKRNPELNAVVVPLFEEARRAAGTGGAPGGDFGGVPILLKDLGACQQGMPQFQGNRALRDAGWRAPTGTPLGERLGRAGFVVLGKTNTPEFGRQPTTQPLAFGPTRNPWDPTRSPGGSSGGSAAAVAAGMVAVAHGTDVSGSIRIPASWCGVVGLKPSRGRTPTTRPMLSAEHVLSRTVRDAAAVLDAVHGAEPGDQFVPRPPARAYAEEARTDPDRLRVGLVTRPGEWAIPVHPDCVAAVESTARLLESLGHVVEVAHPPGLFDPALFRNVLVHGACLLKSRLSSVSAMLERPIGPEDVEPYTWAFATLADSMSGAQYLEALDWQEDYARRVARWWRDGFDLLLTPTTAEPPVALEDLIPPPDDPLRVLPRFGPLMCFTRLFNVTGHPAVSLPLHWSEEGLPIGVQLVADLGREDLLIRTAGQLERARPWTDRRPPFAA